MSADEFLTDVMPAVEEVRQEVSEEDKAAYTYFDQVMTYWESNFLSDTV